MFVSFSHLSPLNFHSQTEIQSIDQARSFRSRGIVVKPLLFVAFLLLLCLLPYLTAASCDVKTSSFKRVLFGSQETGRFVGGEAKKSGGGGLRQALMAILESFLRFRFLQHVVILLQIHSVICYQYKVGDLDSWGLPTSENPKIYMYWSEYHSLKIGDSLMFLYPPSQDSVIQVTKESYNSCNLKDPILSMKDGNSVFNITTYGDLFFTSGVAGHCEKNQKLHISVLSGNDSSASAPSSDGALPEISPSYPTVFGGIPAAPMANSSSSSSSSLSTKISFFLPALVAAFAGVLILIE